VRYVNLPVSKVITLCQAEHSTILSGYMTKNFLLVN